MRFPQISSRTAFHPESRVWVYVAERPLTETETEWLQSRLDAFTQQWTAHNNALKACAEVFDGQVILLMVDETQAGASGCSIDSSVHFLEKAGLQLGVNLFDRRRFGWLEGEQLRFEHQEIVEQELGNGKITADTLMVNTLAGTRRALSEQWLQPLHKSWHKRILTVPAS